MTDVSKWVLNTATSLDSNRTSGVAGLGDAVAVAWRTQVLHGKSVARSGVVTRLLLEPLTETGCEAVGDVLAASGEQTWKVIADRYVRLAVKAFNGSPAAAAAIAYNAPIDQLTAIVNEATPQALIAAWDAVDKRARRSTRLRGSVGNVLSRPDAAYVFTTRDDRLGAYLPYAWQTNSRRYAAMLWNAWQDRIMDAILTDTTENMSWTVLCEAADNVDATDVHDVLRVASMYNDTYAGEVYARCAAATGVKIPEGFARIVDVVRRVDEAGARYHAAIDDRPLIVDDGTNTPGSKWVSALYQLLAIDPAAAAERYKNTDFSSRKYELRGHVTRSAYITWALLDAGAELSVTDEYRLDADESQWVRLYDEAENGADAVLTLVRAGYTGQWHKLARTQEEADATTLALRDEAVHTGSAAAWQAVADSVQALPGPWWDEVCDVEDFDVMAHLTEASNTVTRKGALSAAVQRLRDGWEVADKMDVNVGSLRQRADLADVLGAIT